MKEILELIEYRKQEFSQLPFFQFLRDKNIDPRQKLSFAPVISPLAMGFGELCKEVFRKEPTKDRVQELINKHTYEEHYHWLWLLEDMEKLGLDQTMRFSEALKFIWSPSTKSNRFVCSLFERYAFQADPLLKLVVIQVAEVTGNVFFYETKKVAQQLCEITNEEYRYFGMCHMDKEINHNLNRTEVVSYLNEIQINEETRMQAIEIVDQLFDAFTNVVDEYLAYATKEHQKQLVLQ
jgi:hypothetical protein